MIEKKYTSKDIKALLLKKYSPPTHAFFSEVGDTTGGASRYADGIAYSLYPSTGFEIQGFEIKISHSDFMNEIKNPGKPAEIMKFCDRWWIVAPKGIIKKEELPATWGLIEVRGENKLFTAKQAPLLDHVDLDRPFIASLLRRATENVVPRETLWNAVQMARKQERADLEKTNNEKIAEIKRKLEKVKEFEEASGMQVSSEWRGGKKLGDAVNIILNGRIDGVGREINSAISDLQTAVDILKGYASLEEVTKSLKKICE